MRRQYLLTTLWVICTITASSTSISAHGLVDIDYVNNKIMINPGPNGLVFWDANEGPYIQFGFASDGIGPIATNSAGGHLIAGDVISLQVLGPLLYDPGTGVFGSAGTTSVQIQPTNQTVTGTTGELSPVAWATVQANGFIHQHYSFQFTNEIAGVYGIEFRLFTNRAGIAASDPYLLLFNNGVAEEDMPTVIDNFGGILAPGLLGDLNLDGFVGQDDLNIILGLWGQHVSAGTVGDINDDNFIGQDDLNVVLSEWGQGTLPMSTLALKSQAVPEASSFVLTSAIGLVGLCLWRRSGQNVATCCCS
ncbi:hypothetical protein K2Y11_00990 [bacterium]|nr:hypothetical protein [bacterium]